MTDIVQAPQGGRSAPVDPSLVTWTHAIYALHAASVVLAVVGAATIVLGFVWGPIPIVAVIMNYLKRSNVSGTYLESHFTWQIRTFWYAVIWSIIGVMLWILLGLVLIGFVIGPAILAATGIWVTYRIARGWLALKNGDRVSA
jgi:uncharacterized membrane protein